MSFTTEHKGPMATSMVTSQDTGLPIYKYVSGDVLQKRAEHLKDRPWLDFSNVTTAKWNACVTAVSTGLYAGVSGEWRIVRNGTQVLPS